MTKLNVNPEDLDKALENDLLPIEIEKDVNGRVTMVRAQYLAEVKTAKEHTSREGKISLKLTLGIDYKGRQYYVDDYLTYSGTGAKKLANLVSMTGLDPSSLDTDDFLGRWLWITIQHSSFTLNTQVDVDGNPITIIKNAMGFYQRQATKEEVDKGQSEAVSFP